jgi:hypothetical protein
MFFKALNIIVIYLTIISYSIAIAEPTRVLTQSASFRNRRFLNFSGSKRFLGSTGSTGQTGSEFF